MTKMGLIKDFGTVKSSIILGFSDRIPAHEWLVSFKYRSDSRESSKLFVLHDERFTKSVFTK